MPQDNPHVAVKPWEDWGISKEEFDAYMTRKMARDETAPAVGSRAPGFQAERLTPQGKRTGEMFDLSSTRGRPVALVFGSYT